MENVFERVGHRIYRETYRGKTHAGYVVPWKAIGPLCKKWSGNRDSDLARIEEMVRFREGGGYFPLLLHLAELPEEGLVCYDGNHRREVLNRDPGDPGCVVDVMFAATPSEVFASFGNLNKCVQVPAIYGDSAIPPAVKGEIVALARRYEMEHADFASPSPRCQCPNFNRDIFVEDLTSLYEDFAGSATVGEIAALLGDLNEERSQGRCCKPHSEYPRAAVAKCQKYGFWLFLERHVTSVVLLKLRARRVEKEGNRARYHS